MKLKKRHIKYAVFAVAAVLFIIITVFAIRPAYAAVEPTVELYETFKLQRSNMIMTTLRDIGWKAIKFMAFITKQAEFLLKASMEFISFGISSTVVNLISKYVNPLVGVLLGIGIVFFGLGIMLFIINDRNKILINFMLLLICLVGLPVLMNEMSEIAVAGMDMFISGDSNLGTTEVIAQNVTDFKYVDKTNFSDPANKNDFKDFTASWISIEETIDPGDRNLQNPEIFKHDVGVDANGNVNVVEADFGGWFGIGKSHYYRYNYDFMTIVMTLFATLFVFFFMSYKTIRISWEIAFTRAFAILVSPIDISSGARTKKILSQLITLYVTLIFVGMCFRFFVLAVSYTSIVISNPIYKAFIILFLALVAIDGPNIIERILGMDAGLKSGMAGMFTLFTGARFLSMLGGAASHIKHGGSNSSSDKDSKDGGSNSDSGGDAIYSENSSNSGNSSNNSEKTYGDSGSSSRQGVPYSGGFNSQNLNNADAHSSNISSGVAPSGSNISSNVTPSDSNEINSSGGNSNSNVSSTGNNNVQADNSSNSAVNASQQSVVEGNGVNAEAASSTVAAPLDSDNKFSGSGDEKQSGAVSGDVNKGDAAGISNEETHSAAASDPVPAANYDPTGNNGDNGLESSRNEIGSQTNNSVGNDIYAAGSSDVHIPNNAATGEKENNSNATAPGRNTAPTSPNNTAKIYGENNGSNAGAIPKTKFKSFNIPTNKK